MQVAYEYILEENIIIATAPDSFSDEEVIKGAKKIEDRLKKTNPRQRKIWSSRRSGEYIFIC